MKPIVLLIPMLLPLLSGGVLLLTPDWSARLRNGFSLTAACLTSVLVLMALALVQDGAFTVLRLMGDFTISFRLDGMARLYAGMLAVMWPFALLYAFSYMEHSDPRGRFFAFYLMTYGVALGVAFSANLVTLYVCFEMLTLVTLPLVTHLQNQ